MNAFAQAQQEAAEMARLSWAARHAETAKAACTRAVSLLESAARPFGGHGDEMRRSAVESARAAHAALGEIIREFWGMSERWHPKPPTEKRWVIRLTYKQLWALREGYEASCLSG